MELMPENAPAVVLLFLGTAALVLAATAALVWTGLRRRFRQALRLVEGIAVILVLYTGALLAFSLTSREKILEPGQRKYFCEVDCHLAYAVVGVATARTLGPPSSPATARGNYYVVTVRTWFDEKTISPRRGNAPLWPNPLRFLAAYDGGDSVPVSESGLRALRAIR